MKGYVFSVCECGFYAPLYDTTSLMVCLKKNHIKPQSSENVPTVLVLDRRPPLWRNNVITPACKRS